MNSCRFCQLVRSTFFFLLLPSLLLLLFIFLFLSHNKSLLCLAFNKDLPCDVPCFFVFFPIFFILFSCCYFDDNVEEDNDVTTSTRSFFRKKKISKIGESIYIYIHIALLQAVHILCTFSSSTVFHEQRFCKVNKLLLLFFPFVIRR